VGTDTIDIEDLRPCSGCVVQKGVSKVAVYKDGKGNVHKYSGMQTPQFLPLFSFNPQPLLSLSFSVFSR
jgi:hypothetical protein